MIEVKKDSILPLPNQELINSIEKYYRIKFPETYIKFLMNYNGAIPVKNTFEFDGHSYLVERFLSILGDKINEIEEGWSDIEVIITQIDERLVDDRDMVGMNIIPIAVLFAGDYVCLDFRNESKFPCVCIWYHEQSDPFHPITAKIANNFEGFLDILV